MDRGDDRRHLFVRWFAEEAQREVQSLRRDPHQARRLAADLLQTGFDPRACPGGSFADLVADADRDEQPHQPLSSLEWNSDQLADSDDGIGHDSGEFEPMACASEGELWG